MVFDQSSPLPILSLTKQIGGVKLESCMPIIRTTVPLAEVKRDPTLQRIIERLKQGKQPEADIIAFAKRRQGDLKVYVVST